MAIATAVFTANGHIGAPASFTAGMRPALVAAAIGLQRTAVRGSLSGTCVRRPAEQGQCLTDRVEGPGAFAAEPVVPCHGVRVQRTQPVFALARCRSGRRVSLGVRCGGAPDPGGLQQVGLGEPPRVVGWRPPGPCQLAGGAFLVSQRAERPLVTSGPGGGCGLACRSA